MPAMTDTAPVQDPHAAVAAIAEAADATAVAQALRKSVGRFVRAIRNDSGTATTAQSEVLAQLERDGPASVAALAQARGVKHQSMRLVVARLAELGLLALHADPLDRRSQLVSLTSQGRDDVAADQAARSACLSARIGARLSADERIMLSEAIKLIDRLSMAD